MAVVTAALVKQLRDQTGAGMMDCKAALTETAGDFEGAVDWLRKKGLAAAAKKAGRIAAQGLIGLATAARRGALVEVNSETDFVARNQEFQALVGTSAELALEVGELRDREVDPAVAVGLGHPHAHQSRRLGVGQRPPQRRVEQVQHHRDRRGAERDAQDREPRAPATTDVRHGALPVGLVRP